MSDRERKTLEGVSAFLRDVDPERFTRAIEAVALAESVEAPPSTPMPGTFGPGGFGFGGGGRWLHMRMQGPDFLSIAQSRARERLGEDLEAMASANPVEEREDKRFALLEVGESEP